MTVRSTSRAPAWRTIADAPRARAATVRVATATVFAVALATMVFTSPRVFAADPASEAAASAVGTESATRFTVKPGQSLNDVAIAVTQSHDRAVLSRASKAIFDANPASFMRGDPSLMKLGAVLTIPPLDSTGAVVAQTQTQAPSAASSPASGTAAAAASAPRGTTPASSAAGASAPVASAPALPASSAATPRAAAPSASGAAPASATAAPATTAAGGGHAWTGTIQQAPVTPAASEASPAGASEAGAPASASASVASSSGTGASASGSASTTAARPHTFSSLQQLLAFKNRVLMDLQRHGFGSKGSHEAAAGASGASVAIPSQTPRQAAPVLPMPHSTQSGERFIGIGGYGVSVARASVPTIAAVASAIVAALLVLIVAIVMGARKRRAARATPEPVPAPESTAATRAVSELESAPAHAEGPQDPVETEYLSTLARTPTSKRALMGLAGHYAERGNARGFDEIAQRIMRLSGGKGPNWLHIAALGRQLDPDNPLYASSVDEADDTFVESVAGEDALPPHSAQAQSGADEPDAEVKLSGDGQHMASAATPIAATDEAESTGHPAVEPAADVQEGEATAHAAPAAQPEAPPPVPETFAPREVPEAGIREPRFPAEAIAALNDLDLGLPPRVETEPAHEQESALHEDTAADVDVGEGREPGLAAELEDARSPQSVQEPEDARAHMAAQGAESKHELDSASQLDSEREHRTTHEAEPSYDPESTHEHELAHELEPAHEPEALHEPEPEPEHRPEPTHAPASAAGTPPAVAGLGAARFGPLKLAFDLDLPADDSTGAAASTPPQPAFTAEEIAKIARNKLELAAEYIELGDLGGARTLIHEVIESNDPGTRDEAQALLATLAPLS